MDTLKAIPCMALSFSNNEMNDIKEFLSENDYSPDSDGLKEYILDTVYDDTDEEKRSTEKDIVNQINNFLADNPNTVNMAANLGSAIFNKIKNRKR
jgi:hypothetical protein